MRSRSRYFRPIIKNTSYSDNSTAGENETIQEASETNAEKVTGFSNNSNNSNKSKKSKLLDYIIYLLITVLIISFLVYLE